MKFAVLNRFSGEVQFTADIDCDASASRSVKLGLAVKWAIENKADLRGADLRGADLRGANLSEANLREADLRGANLSGADLRWADLSGADLRWADLRWANLSEANLRGANLRWANLSEANLCWADLRWANLSEANLREANLREAVGNNKEIITIQSGKYIITLCRDVMAIGCQQHTVDSWMDFDDATIRKMDHGALEWWRVWKPIIQQLLAART